MTRSLPTRSLRPLAAAVLCGGLAAGLACAPGPQPSDMSRAELLERIEAGTAPLILDVRTPGEYAEGHVPGALNIPHDEVGDRMAEIESRVPRDGEVVLYCKSGVRAGWARETLEESGFTGLRHLRGDMSAWLEAGLPTE